MMHPEGHTVIPLPFLTESVFFHRLALLLCIASFPQLLVYIPMAMIRRLKVMALVRIPNLEAVQG